MAKLTAKQRNALSANQFGLPGSGKYPMPDAAHAANAKARATQQVKKGNLSPSTAAAIKAKANKVLGKTSSKPTSGKITTTKTQKVQKLGPGRRGK